MADSAAQHSGMLLHYEGERKDGMLHGQGRATYTDGSIYEGHWVKGNQH
jgi:hypothetical protein